MTLVSCAETADSRFETAQPIRPGKASVINLDLKGPPTVFATHAWLHGVGIDLEVRVSCVA
jgi:hypothetical protein